MAIRPLIFATYDMFVEEYGQQMPPEMLQAAYALTVAVAFAKAVSDLANIEADKNITKAVPNNGNGTASVLTHPGHRALIDVTFIQYSHGYPTVLVDHQIRPDVAKKAGLPRTMRTGDVQAVADYVIALYEAIG